MGQSFLDYRNLLRPEGVTLLDARKSSLAQNEQTLEWSLLLQGQQGLKKDWGVESTANWLQVHLSLFETQIYWSISFSVLLTNRNSFNKICQSFSFSRIFDQQNLSVK